MTEEALQKILNAKRTRISKQGKISPGFEKATFADFFKWFNQETFNKGCHYCGLKDEQSLSLFQQRMYATRGGKRGKRLELDRLNPNLPYDELENLVWCCYWCNNAKSNFFAPDEFMSIGNAIGLELRKILAT